MQSVGKTLKSRTNCPTRLSKCSVTYVLSVTVLLRSALTRLYQMFRLLNGILPKTSTLHMCVAESERLSFTPITRKKHRRYRFEETYGYGYIHYALYDDNGKEIDLHTVDALSWIDSKGVTFDESYMWAVPVLYGKSCHKGRGAGIIGIKTDAFDSLDEVWSQWMDALRACRTKQYVPDCLVPRNPETCQPISPNPFDNRFIAVGNDMSETATATGFTPKVRRFSTKAI